MLLVITTSQYSIKGKICRATLMCGIVLRLCAPVWVARLCCMQKTCQQFWSFWYTYLLTHLLTPLSRILKRLTVSQLVKKFPAFYGTRTFITAVTSVRHLSLSCASSIQSILPHPTSWRSVLILSSHLRLGLPNGLFLSGFPTKTVYTTLLSTIRATCPAHLILLDCLTRTVLAEEYRSLRSF